MELSAEEHRFVVDTIRNVIFDLREDDISDWDAAIEELQQALEALGVDREDEESEES